MRCARLHTIAVIIFLSGAAASAQTPESPHDLWEHMIAAKGGHERLQSVRTFAWMATVVTPSHRNWSEGPSMVYVAAPPDHLWIDESGYVETWRGRGLSSPRMGIPATLPSLEAWQLACFLESSVVRPTPVSVDPSAEDARVVIGSSIGATVLWTSGAPRETSPHSTYVGGQAGILLYGVKVDLGIDVRVRGGEPNAPHAAGFRWSVGYQVPIVPW